jgi:hypothetical protein
VFAHELDLVSASACLRPRASLAALHVEIPDRAIIIAEPLGLPIGQPLLDNLKVLLGLKAQLVLVRSPGRFECLALRQLPERVLRPHGVFGVAPVIAVRTAIQLLIRIVAIALLALKLSAALLHDILRLWQRTAPDLPYPIFPGADVLDGIFQLALDNQSIKFYVSAPVRLW